MFWWFCVNGSQWGHYSSKYLFDNNFFNVFFSNLLLHYFSVCQQGSRDNMSVVLVCFPGAPKINPEAVKREAELDKYLQNREGGACKKANK